MLERVLRVLEYDKMKQQLKAHIASSLGRKKAEELQPLTDLETVKREQKRTYEGTKVLRLKGQAPLGGSMISSHKLSVRILVVCSTPKSYGMWQILSMAADACAHSFKTWLKRKCLYLY